jgi:hypothetical protein
LRLWAPVHQRAEKRRQAFAEAVARALQVQADRAQQIIDKIDEKLCSPE